MTQRLVRPALRPTPPAAGVSLAAARSAGLRWVSDDGPGMRRVRAGRGFRYADPSVRPVADDATLGRIRSLAVPPAWRDVWICPDPHGHIQATGRDAKGRKQYRYHPRWRAARDLIKYDRLLEFGRALPGIRERMECDLARRGLPREKVLATVLRLLEKTLIRVGNEEYARANRSFGLTTLDNRHVVVRGPRIHFRFRGKSGKVHEFGIEDAGLSRIVKRCQDLPGQDLFQYRDARGRRRGVGSGDVNAYLAEVSGRDFTAKDFRTWAGSVRAWWALAARPAPQSKAQGRRAVNDAIGEVARRLGNTPAIARNAYVHPAVVESYLDGKLRRRRAAGVSRLQPSEVSLLRLLSTWKPETPEAKLTRQLGASTALDARHARA